MCLVAFVTTNNSQSCGAISYTLFGLVCPHYTLPEYCYCLFFLFPWFTYLEIFDIYIKRKLGNCYFQSWSIEKHALPFKVWQRKYFPHFSTFYVHFSFFKKQPPWIHNFRFLLVFLLNCWRISKKKKMVNKTNFHSIAYFVSKNESFKEGYFKNICLAEKPNESFSNKPEKKS